jgi:hypothetical protein
MSALFLLLATTASAAPVHHISLQAQRYASRPSEIAHSLEASLVNRILEICGPAKESDVKVHKLELRINPLGDHGLPMLSRAGAEPKPWLMILDYPRGELEADIECP